MTAAPLDRVIERCGSQAQLARALGVTPQSITKWRKHGVPATRVIAMERVTGAAVTRHELRPDIYPPPPPLSATPLTMADDLRHAAMLPAAECGGSTCKLVLMGLAAHADSEGVCWPSAKRLATWTGLSHRTVTRALHTLRSAGLVDWQHRFNADKGQQSNLFQLRLRESTPPSAPEWRTVVREFAALHGCEPAFEEWAISMDEHTPEALGRAWRTWTSRHGPTGADAVVRVVDGVPLRGNERIGASGEIETHTPGAGWGEIVGERRRRTVGAQKQGINYE